MPPDRTPPLRKAAAARLRSVADRIDPVRVLAPPRSPAPLVRLGGRWWPRDELVALTQSEGADVQLRP